MKITEIVAKLIDETKLSGVELAKALGVTDVYVSYLKNGKRDIGGKLLEQLAELARCEIVVKRMRGKR